MSTLYKEGIYSDVCIELTAPHFLANKIMKLHKTIICQSAYFQALFNASWKEANQEVIKIAITDRNITERSIDILFESFYTSTLNYDSNEEDLISLLATARMFTADEVANLCAKELFSIVTMNVSISYKIFCQLQDINSPFLLFRMSFTLIIPFHHTDFPRRKINHSSTCYEIFRTGTIKILNLSKRM